LFAYTDLMKATGFDQRPDFSRMGLTLLVASALILAIRTARWPATLDENLVSPELDQEIDYAVLLATRTLFRLLKHKESMFPSRREPRYAPGEEENPP
jgi:hypothetical protein